MNDDLDKALWLATMWDAIEDGKADFPLLSPALLDLHHRLKAIEARFPVQQDYINPRIEADKGLELPPQKGDD